MRIFWFHWFPQDDPLSVHFCICMEGGLWSTIHSPVCVTPIDHLSQFSSNNPAKLIKYLEVPYIPQYVLLLIDLYLNSVRKNWQSYSWFILGVTCEVCEESCELRCVVCALYVYLYWFLSYHLNVCNHSCVYTMCISLYIYSFFLFLLAYYYKWKWMTHKQIRIAAYVIVYFVQMNLNK